MVVGALASAFAPSLAWLLAARFVLGVGVGGDYPVSAVLMTEYANRSNRGKLVGLVFSMQALGTMAGYAAGLILLFAGLPFAGLELGGFTCVAIAFFLNTGSYYGEILRAGIESIPRGQVEAARSTGLSGLQSSISSSRALASASSVSMSCTTCRTEVSSLMSPTSWPTG